MKIRLLVTILASLSLLFVAPACGDSGSTDGTGSDDTAGTAGDTAGTADDAGTGSDTGGTADDAGTTGPADTGGTGGGNDTGGTGGGNDTGGGTGGTDTGGGGGTDDTTGGTDTPPAGEICPQLWECITDECGTSDDALTCAEGAAATCGTPADESEWTAATTLLTCMVDNLCELTEGNFGPECQASKCLAETVGCWALPTGEGTCVQMRSCTSGCVDPIFGTPDLPCQRECLNSGSPAAVEMFVDLELCVSSQCWDKAAGEEFDICANDAEGNPTCGQQYTECLGDIGAGPGAGAGGSK